MKLHEAIDRVLQSADKPLQTRIIAERINERQWYRRGDGKPLPSNHVGARVKNYPLLFFKKDGLVFRASWKSSGPNRKEVPKAAGRVVNRVESNDVVRSEHIGHKAVSDLDKALLEGFQFLGDMGQLIDSRVPRNPALTLPGVYMLTTTEQNPHFLSSEQMANVLSPWSVEALQSKWVAGTAIVYIGLAGLRTPRSLHQRIGDLVRHASGRTSSNGPHKGGEFLWQLKGWKACKVWVRPTGPPPDPRNEERNLMERFMRQYGALPFANRRR